MSKLYVFGIGGTGSRVIKSLTMLLAAGVDCGVDTIIPIIIDRDEDNGDYTRTKLLIDDYVSVNEIAKKTDKNKFFKTKIELLNNELLLKLKDNTEKFEEFIGKDSMSNENKALVDMLFSKETLNLNMSAGFQGNPNIGSVVLNQFDDSNIFSTFASNFTAGDKIFIISSIFGGTGASGFPLLRKVLHTKNQTAKGQELASWGLINDAPIGAISVLPYFKVKSRLNRSLVDSDTFIDKAKAALSYYKTEDKHIDTLYYIADKQTTSYEHHNGGKEQRNDAHFVELASAMAILDFVNPHKIRNNINRNEDKSISKTTYKEFGISKNYINVNFDILANETYNILVNPLSRFVLFCKYMGYLVVEKMEDGKITKIVEVDNSTFDKKSKHQPYSRKWNKPFKIKELDAVQLKFFSWLMEMENQTRIFSPFNLETKSAFDFVNGNSNLICNPKWFDIGFKDWARMDNELNRQISTIDKSWANERQFIELFYRVTESLINTSKN